MKADVISVGTELLLGQTTDTNATYISQRLADIGVLLQRRPFGVHRSSLAADDESAITFRS